jgi:GrxC family glutaredoxin
MFKIYTRDYCPYCEHAKALLKRLNLPYEEIHLEIGSEEMQALIKKTNHMTMPQIFIENKFIGGYDDLKSLADSGELEQFKSE